MKAETDNAEHLNRFSNFLLAKNSNNTDNDAMLIFRIVCEPG